MHEETFTHTHTSKHAPKCHLGNRDVEVEHERDEFSLWMRRREASKPKINPIYM